MLWLAPMDQVTMLPMKLKSSRTMKISQTGVAAPPSTASNLSFMASAIP